MDRRGSTLALALAGVVVVVVGAVALLKAPSLPGLGADRTLTVDGQTTGLSQEQARARSSTADPALAAPGARSTSRIYLSRRVRTISARPGSERHRHEADAGPFAASTACSTAAGSQP